MVPSGSVEADAGRPLCQTEIVVTGNPIQTAVVATLGDVAVRLRA